MKELIENYQNEYGYTPTYYELFELHQQGYLSLTDKQENELLGLITFNNNTDPNVIYNIIVDKNKTKPNK